MNDRAFVEAADPDEVFGILSNEIRVGILQALWEAEGYEASFSELREAVGTRDSGQFNYHLDRLVGRFLARTEEGYELTQAGMQINGAIQTGAYTTEGSIDSLTLDDPCPTCGGTRTLSYDDETLGVECDGCPVGYQAGIPPAAFAGSDRDELPQVASEYLRTTIRHVTSGFCPYCDGPVVPTVGSVADLDAVSGAPEEDADGDTGAEFPDVSEVPLIRFDCGQCGASPTAGLHAALLDHPAVVSFHYDHGIDVRGLPVWDLPEADPGGQAIRSRDPFRATVTYEVEDDALTVVVDEAFEVVGIEG